MSMFDAAFHDIPCHNAIRVPQGYMVVCKNDITKKETVDMVVSWCGFLRPRWMFAYHIPDDATWHTRAKMCPTTCVVQQNDTSRKGLWWSMVLAFVYSWWPFYSLSVVPRCHMPKYACQACRQLVLCMKVITSKRMTWMHHGKRGFLQWEKKHMERESARMFETEWKYNLSTVGSWSCCLYEQHECLRGTSQMLRA